jgi:hypothetical protein
VEFLRNFTERGELGAAFAVVHDGVLVVDLWGGIADSTACISLTTGSAGPAGRSSTVQPDCVASTV